MEDNFREAGYCNETTLAEATVARGELYASVWNHVLAQHQEEAAQWPPFAWLMDLTSGSRLNPELKRRAQLPMLAVAANPHDGHTFLVPDAFMLLGVLAAWGMGDVIPRPFREMAGHYNHSYFWNEAPAVPWEDRQPRAVFRGSCHPTLDSSKWEVHERLWLRAELCSRHGGKKNLFDIGVFTQGSFSPCNFTEGMQLLSWCQDCHNCSHAARLSPEDMVGYRYQLLVDGHGPGYDAAIWKLLSGSTSFLVTPDETGGVPLFNMFYTPVMSAHYIQAALGELESAVHYCDESPAACAGMGRAARRAMRCLLRPAVALKYMWGVLQRLHSFHFARLDATQ